MTSAEIWNMAGAVIGSFGAAGAVLWGLSSFLSKVWVNRILQQDIAKYSSTVERLRSELEGANRRLQSEIDRSLDVRRTHFGNEFQALRTVWMALAKTRRRMSALRPIFRVVGEDDTTDTEFVELQRNFRRFARAFGRAQDAVDDAWPFLTDEVYTKAWDALKVAGKEHLTVRLHAGRRSEKHDWYDEGKKNLDEIEVQLKGVVAVIRARLNALSGD